MVLDPFHDSGGETLDDAAPLLQDLRRVHRQRSGAKRVFVVSDALDRDLLGSHDPVIGDRDSHVLHG